MEAHSSSSRTIIPHNKQNPFSSSYNNTLFPKPLSFKTNHNLSFVFIKNSPKIRLLTAATTTTVVNSSLFKLESVLGEQQQDNKYPLRNNNNNKLAVFVSGGGSNFKSIHQSSLHGLVNGDILVLVTNKLESTGGFGMRTKKVLDRLAVELASVGGVTPSEALASMRQQLAFTTQKAMADDCGGAEYARNNNIPVVVFPKTKQNSESLSVNDLIVTLRRYVADFILLAGYLKLIPDELVRAFPKSILNVHPSLLPAFGGKGYYGIKVHQAVIASGARYSGPTIHFVDEHYDTGRILAQRVVPVLATDTAADLAARVLEKLNELPILIYHDNRARAVRGSG